MNINYRRINSDLRKDFKSKIVNQCSEFEIQKKRMNINYRRINSDLRKDLKSKIVNQCSEFEIQKKDEYRISINE